MKRIIVLIALLAILPVLVVIAYFGAKVQWPTREPAAADASGGPAGRQPSPRGDWAAPPPPVEGPVLRPQGPRGETVVGPLVDRQSHNTLEIRPGDTLFQIALTHYGDASYVDDILVANPGLNPNSLRPGRRIILPPKSAEGQPSRPQASAEPRVYVVRQGDTLIGIAGRMYGDRAMYSAIFDLNRDVLRTPESIRPGMRLRLPPTPEY